MNRGRGVCISVFNGCLQQNPFVQKSLWFAGQEPLSNNKTSQVQLPVLLIIYLRGTYLAHNYRLSLNEMRWCCMLSTRALQFGMCPEMQSSRWAQVGWVQNLDVKKSSSQKRQIHKDILSQTFWHISQLLCRGWGASLHSQASRNHQQTGCHFADQEFPSSNQQN